MTIRKNKISGKDQVDEFIANLDHPFKKEIESLRSIILDANKNLNERLKWNSPSFYYLSDFAAFNLRAKHFVQIIFIFYNGNMIEDPSILEGNWIDRREARFYSLADIYIKQDALKQFVNNWIALVDHS
ncbi:DUF1801 domain-containing protein [Pedobacter mucosus]|uniref:DUF1801 domain-containing protein n=1 Tax=Pedobacter mucosus TaxID=2895286 RepID=UPI001EE4A453|nr:DUF1801 domain-containing protein [Pedobacter mucosus]UKT62187.1 DUF1801 domain-containing protein [Pedobacter mucosus]